MCIAIANLSRFTVDHSIRQAYILVANLRKVQEQPSKVGARTTQTLGPSVCYGIAFKIDRDGALTVDVAKVGSNLRVLRRNESKAVVLAWR